MRPDPVQRTTRIGPGLGFRFELPPNLLRRVDRFLEYYLDLEAPGDEGAPLLVNEEPPSRDLRKDLDEELGTGTVLLEEPPLVVRRKGRLVCFELPRIRAWCDGALGRGGVVQAEPSEDELEHFVSMALAPLLIELASGRGWFGVHAAGVVIDGVGILLPGPSGAGKSTIFTDVHQAGHGVLSDDLLWLRPGSDAVTLYSFPRGGYGGAVPAPSVPCAPLGAIVCPVITGGEAGRLVLLSPAQALEVLVAEGGFLGAGAGAGERFGALVDLAGSVPAYRLEAGPRDQTPGLLARLATSLSASDPANHRP